MKKNVSLLRADWEALRSAWQGPPDAGRPQEQAFAELADILNGLTGPELLAALLFRSHTLEMPDKLVAALADGRKRFAAEVQNQRITTRQQTSEKALLLLATKILVRQMDAAPGDTLADNATNPVAEDSNQQLETFEL